MTYKVNMVNNMVNKANMVNIVNMVSIWRKVADMFDVNIATWSKDGKQPLALSTLWRV